MVTVGFGDIVPSCNSERIILCFYMFFGVVLYSYTIDNLLNIMNNIDREHQNLTQLLADFNELANQMKLSDFIREKVLNYIWINHKYSDNAKIYPKSLMKIIP